jgi:dihydroorotate dehydrogenase (NAD+) catalytic subunit
MDRLKIRLGKIRMRTPLIAVSGVFGLEYANLVPGLPCVGAVVSKSVTLHPRQGNPHPRVIETPAGLLNAIGLQNPGINAFIEQEIPKLRTLEVPVIASVAGASIDEYVQCSKLLAQRDEIDAIELNVSCPNVEMGEMEFGTDPTVLEQLVTSVRRVLGEKTLIVKLTPNITDIVVPAQAAINGGADVISLINTLHGMAIDLKTRKPKLGNQVGGLSGRAIHPVAVYMVHRCYTLCCRDHQIPIIGIGGVSEYQDAMELILVGATCVGIGTAMFLDDRVFEKIAKEMDEYVANQGESSIGSLVGKAA